jgi:5-methyltetrahydrofolate--homocysteine methyltransferase
VRAILQEIYQDILDGEHTQVGTLIQAALNAGLPAGEVLERGMIAAMTEVGHRFETGKYYVPEMLISARAMQAGLAVIRPALREADVQPAGKVAIGTVQGDLHDIGKSLVGMMLEGAGFEVLDLGTSVSPAQFVAAADAVEVIGLSALLTTSMPNMATVLEALQAAGKRRRVKVIVGGAPVTARFAESIGADGYAPDASRAVRLTCNLLGR